jgi:PKD repeat protein
MNPSPATGGEAITGFWGVNSTNMYLVSYEPGAWAFNYSGGDEWVYTSTGTGRLNAIWGSSGSDIYVAGTGGHIARYNGSAWSGVSSATTQDLNSLHGSSSSNVFAVGRQGAIVHNKGAGFVAESFATTGDLFGVWAAPDGSAAYAVGTDGLILKYTPDPVTTTTTTPGGTTTTTTPGGTTTTTTPGGTTTTSTVMPGDVGADFIASPLTGRVPLQVQFTNLSGGDITSYQWSFGDGSSSTERNPSHVYQNSGTYDVILTVIGEGKTATKMREDYITAQSRCPVARSVNNTNALDALRALRDSRSDTVMGSVLIALFYRNADEAAALLDASPDLRLQLAGLIEGNLPVFEALLQGNAASVPAAAVDELLGFLYRLQAKAGRALAADVDFVIRGIERGVLLPAMGISVK